MSPVVQGILLPEVSPGSASMESWIAGALELDSHGSWVMGGPRLRRSSSTVSSVDCSESDGELIPHQEPSNEEESGSPAVVQPSSSSSAVPESCRAGPEVYHIASAGRVSSSGGPEASRACSSAPAATHGAGVAAESGSAGSQPGPSAPGAGSGGSTSSATPAPPSGSSAPATKLCARVAAESGGSAGSQPGPCAPGAGTGGP